MNNWTWQWFVYVAITYIVLSLAVGLTTEPYSYVDEVPYISHGWEPLVEDC